MMGALLFSISMACQNSSQKIPTEANFSTRLAENGPIDDPSTIDDVGLDLPLVDGSTWIESFVPGPSYQGINLVLYRRRVPMLIDMNGRILHTWPNVRAVGRARLNKNGRLSVLGNDNLIKEYSWDGVLTWFYKPAIKDDFPHHDFCQLDNGNYLVIVRRAQKRTDDIREIDRAGNVVWQWRSDLNLEKYFPHYDHESFDPVHANSVRVLPPNPWFNNGDRRFKPGNVLVSARNLNRIFIIDKETKEVVWQFGEGLDFQHEANMIPPEYPHSGLILLFNNGYKNLREYRSSAVQAIDPIQSKVVWEYRDPGFYSSVAGADQPLPNGNILITSSESGRAFEVNPQGKTVWEWVPPYLPMRIIRYPLNYCQQFTGLRKDPAHAVALKRNFPFIDMELYAFTIPEEQLSLTLDGRDLWVLPDNNACRELKIPPSATIKWNYGFNKEILGDRKITAHIRCTVRSEKTKVTRVLFERSLDSSEKLWDTYNGSLEDFGLQTVKMCVSTTYEGPFTKDEAQEIIVLVKPVIRSPLIRTYREGRPPRPKNAQEEALRIQQLKALGYVQ